MSDSLERDQSGKILFCGAFRSPENGTVGGVLYACQSLLSTRAAKSRSWTLIDSAQPLPPPPFAIRLFHAGKRWLHAIYSLLLGNIQSTLVFSPFLTMSLLEKLTICLLSALLGKPTVIAFRSEIALPKRSRWLVRFLLGLTLKRLTAVICQSDQARDSLIELFPDVRKLVFVIPNWIDLKNAMPHGCSREQRSKSDVCRITYIGWLEPIKDVPTILKALGNVSPEHSNWELSIGGSGSQLEYLRELARVLQMEDKVKFLGWIDASQKAELLRNTDLFVMASLSEGMPNSLVEAMACGITVACSDVGGVPTLVKDEVHGLLFPPRDVSAAADRFQRLIADPEMRSRIGRKNEEQIRANHNAEKAADTILHLLSSSTVVRVENA